MPVLFLLFTLSFIIDLVLSVKPIYNSPVAWFQQETGSAVGNTAAVGPTGKAEASNTLDETSDGAQNYTE